MFELRNKNTQKHGQHHRVILRLPESLMHMLAVVKAKLCSAKDAKVKLSDLKNPQNAVEVARNSWLIWINEWLIGGLGWWFGILGYL